MQIWRMEKKDAYESGHDHEPSTIGLEGPTIVCSKRRNISLDFYLVSGQFELVYSMLY